jgi:NDP-sugar pyrophosphorylase family protein
VVDDAGRLTGVLTDGDIRRALLAGVALGNLMQPFVKRQFTRVDPAADRSSVLDLMQARTLSQVPITDAEGTLVGIHTFHSILGAMQRPNVAVVMAGGRGERLRPHTDDLPKPMIRVAGRPILERLVLHLVGYGVRRIFLAVNYKAEAIEAHFAGGAEFGCTIEYLRENEPLGTGGALSLLPELPTDHPILVLNGDLLTQFDVASLLAFHEEGGYSATMGVHEYSHTIPLGVVESDGPKVVNIREKPTEVWRVNAGIYVLRPELVARVPQRTFFGLPALIEGCLDRGEPVGAFHVADDWIDVGQHSELRRARGKD